jgi:predicted nucleic acid-binding protein
MDREDCIIGATAALNDEPVVTRNTEHFDRIDGLRVETY